MTPPLRPEQLELLSRYRAGELDPAEAAELERRLGADPALARGLAWLERLDGGLSALGAAPPPPPPRHLDEAVLRRLSNPADETETEPEPVEPTVARPTRPVAIRGVQLVPPTAAVDRAADLAIRRTTFGIVVALAAALAALAVWWPSPAPTVVVGRGVQRVEGRATILAPGQTIELDGVALVRVERPRGLVRVEQGAAGGAAVTIAVYKGSARVHSSNGGAETLHAGDTRRLLGPAGADPEAPPAEPAHDDAALTASERRITELEQELDRARAETQLVRAQLAGREGLPQTWPNQVPEAFTAEGFEARAGELVGRIAGAELARVDCAEYPCLAVYRVPAGNDSWGPQLRAAIHEQFGPHSGAFVFGFQDERGGGGPTLAAVAALPDEASLDDPGLHTRVSTRIEPLVEELQGGE